MPFNSYHFREVAETWNFDIVTTSPQLAEKGIHIDKNLF